MALPNHELLNILEKAYEPCLQFSEACCSMRWEPQKGHVPRGFLGAAGDLSDVELVLVVAEPGDPQKNESYSDVQPPRELLESVCRYVHECFHDGKDLFHRNIRYILDNCWPDLDFDSQLRHVWITESVLCSAKKEGEHVPVCVSRACVQHYLEKQIALFPDALIAVLGAKAFTRLKHVEGQMIKAHSVAPPGCNRKEAKESWDKIIHRVRHHSG